MKNLMNFMLMAALMCGMSLTITSCKDDDKDNNNDQQQQEQQAKEAEEQAEREIKCFAILNQLASVTNPDGFLTKTYEPTIGTADENDANIRIVNTNTMEAAALRFADLAEVDIDENTPSYTWKDDMLGTMTYTKSTDGKSWATVDVSIKQMPHLTKIIYRSGEQGDNNGAFKGRAYYRFGDVIAYGFYDREKGAVYELWVCVRPAFGPEGKDKSHWICIDNNLPEGNIKEHSTDDDEQTWYLPTALGDSKEHMQNFAEMIYAMLDPDNWEANIRNKNNKKLRMFTDFDKAKVDYHNKYFWKRVSKQWDQEYTVQKKTATLWEHVFGMTKDELKTMLNANGLRLLHNGYSWQWWLTEFLGGWNCTLYEATYKNGTGEKANMHDAQYNTIKKKMKITDKGKTSYVFFSCWNMSNVDNYKEFFGNNYRRYCVRYATGTGLGASQNWTPTVKDKIAGTEDLYTYYVTETQKQYEELDKQPEISEEKDIDAEFIVRDK